MVISKKIADAVVIGGGIMGCSAAYYLLKAGVRDVILVERGELCAGSTGKCAGGVRQRFPSLPETLLAKESLEILANVSKELSADVEYRKGGYLDLIYTHEEEKIAKDQMAWQRGLGIDIEWLTVEKIKKFAPWLNEEDGFRGAVYCPSDGMLNPIKLTKAYALAINRMNGDFRLYTSVTNITRKESEFKINTTNGEIVSKLLVNCTGTYAPDIGEMIGYKIPIKAVTREKLLTESVDFIQSFLCNSLLHKMHFNQLDNGCFMMGCATTNNTNMQTTKNFKDVTVSAFSSLVPNLSKIKIIRHWAGYYENTPDGKPFIGGINGINGYGHSIGFNGHGLMLAPAATKACVQYLLNQKTPEWFSTFDIARLKQ